MSALTHEIKKHIIDDFLNGISAEQICLDYKVTPAQLVAFFHLSKLAFVNELFEHPEETTMNLSQIQHENSQLKEQYDILDTKIKEYEIEIRIHKEVLETLLMHK